MIVRTLGVTGSASGPDSPASTYLIQVSAADVAAGIAAGTIADSVAVRDWALVMDIGQGGFGLIERHVPAHGIDAVAISHFHADHFADICSFYVHLKYHPIYGYQWSGNPPFIPVLGPSTIRENLNTCCCTIDDGNTKGAFEPLPWDDDIPVQIGPITILPRRVYHTVETFGMRITAPSAERGGELATVAYSGDTDYCAAVVDLARDADIFFCEASFIEGRDDKAPRGLHLTGTQAGQIAREAGVKYLVLTHIPSWNIPEDAVAEASKQYSGPITLAQCNGSFEL